MGNNSIFGAVVLVVIVAFIGGVGPAALLEGSAPTGVDNESISVDYNNDSSVDKEGIEYDEQVTVVNDGTELERDVDYSWDASTGNVTWFDTQNTNDNDDARIDYTYYQPTEETFNLAKASTILLIGLSIVAVWILGSIAISGRF